MLFFRLVFLLGLFACGSAAEFHSIPETKELVKVCKCGKEPSYVLEDSIPDGYHRCD